MGVTGLWTVVAPTARPTKLETLNRKRLAVDASIWIYQFLKAVRDKEGNALRNSHVVGFFRRICKLLYFGIKPVFVFDGGAPTLKRETIRTRARRREGRRDDATRTAGKLLAVQVARAAEEEARRRKEEQERAPEEEELPPEEELVYVDEIGMSRQERQAARGFKKRDQYHLPDLDVSLESMGAPNDPRVMSQAELEEYAKQFHSGEDINLYDFSKIDFDSPFFLSLPPGDRYNILNAARLRSRLRMGYSKEQLDGMFPDRMAFSRFQIERVKERNELTQRLMHINGMNEGEWNQGGRIAGERGKEYVLVRNDGVEGGWALGVVSNKRGTRKDDAINLDEEDVSEDEGTSSDNEDFEDVAIEGLNRLPTSWKRKRKELREVDYDVSYEEAAERIARKRKQVYDARRQVAATRSTMPDNRIRVEKPAPEDRMFLDNDDGQSDEDEAFEDVKIPTVEENEDDDLQRAIAMSLEKPEEEGGFVVEENDDVRAAQDNAEDDFDLSTALAESRKTKYTPQITQKPSSASHEFSGPLPFESLNLGQSLLGKKKAQKIEEGLSGGFDRDAGEDAFRKQKKAQPMPDWFEAAPVAEDLRPNGLADDDNQSDDHVTFGQEDINRSAMLRRNPTKEIIDLEAEEEPPSQQQAEDPEPVSEEQEDWNMVSEGEDEKEEEANRLALEQEAVNQARRDEEAKEREKRYEMARQIASENEPEPKKDDIADDAQANPPPPSRVPNSIPSEQPMQIINENASEASETVDWSESEDEAIGRSSIENLDPSEIPAGGRLAPGGQNEESDQDEDDLFEDVEVASLHKSSPKPIRQLTPPPEEPVFDQSLFIAEDEETEAQPAGEAEQDNYMSDSDEELMRQMAIEAEEHARFASELNNKKTPAEAARDYENELKQLRNQQKKDRRDADEVTQVMIQECQALLRLFGLPYITAPMEAEAQCAELVHLGLVDGIVTDDSDIFLFGGTRIYKNMFNAAKFVECYLASDLEKEYALDRNKLIRFAHLLGSDYTEGLPGIGPVTALEIISDFDTLQEFKEWCSKVQIGNPASMENQLTTSFRRKFKNTVQKRLFLPTNFPDMRVDHAYLNPDVDANPEEFQWGVPDLDKLRSYLMATIGWSQDRTDEILVPVIRDINKRESEGTQANITRFFSGGVGVGAAPVRNADKGDENTEGAAPRNRTGKESGRMKNAYKRLRGEAEKKKRVAIDGVLTEEAPATEEDMSVEDAEKDIKAMRKKPKSKRVRSKVSPVSDEVGEDDDNANDGGESADDDNGDFNPQGKAKSGTKRRRVRKQM